MPTPTPTSGPTKGGIKLADLRTRLAKIGQSQKDDCPSSAVVSLTAAALARLRIAVLMGAVVSLSCAGCDGRSYGGIDLRTGRAPSEVQDLALRARAGDKRAQLELGILYEEGRGVPRDLRRAKAFYSLATEFGGKKTYVYTPAVGAVRGQVISVQARGETSTVVEARRRLERLDRSARSSRSKRR